MSILKIFKKRKEAPKEKDVVRTKEAEDARHVEAKKEKEQRRKTLVEEGVKTSTYQAKDEEKRKYTNAYRKVVRPVVTEKSADLASANKYVFEVMMSMNKIEIKKAIKNLYGVTPIHIRTLHISGKNVRYGKTRGRTSDWKKAIVSLKKGDKIEVYEGV